MTFNEFHNSMISLVVFSYDDINTIFGGIDRRRIYEWRNKGYITQLIKGYYIFSEFLETESIGLLISNKINSPSYLSLEYVMSTGGLIPESVYSYTAVTTKKTTVYDTMPGTFVYRSIKPDLFLGYSLYNIKINLSGRVLDRYVKVACLEKAFFDFLYLNRPGVKNREIDDYRFESGLLKRMDKNKLFGYAELSGNDAVTRRLDKILKHHAVY